MSSGDNSNIIAARVARETFGVRHVVARIYDPKRAEVYERLGIPTVATVPWTTDRLMRCGPRGGQAAAWRDPSGTVTIMMLPVHRGWVGRKIAGWRTRSCVPGSPSSSGSATACCPEAETVMQDGDLIYVAALSGDHHRNHRGGGPGTREEESH